MYISRLVFKTRFKFLYLNLFFFKNTNNYYNTETNTRIAFICYYCSFLAPIIHSHLLSNYQSTNPLWTPQVQWWLQTQLYRYKPAHSQIISQVISSTFSLDTTKSDVWGSVSFMLHWFKTNKLWKWCSMFSNSPCVSHTTACTSSENISILFL